MRSSEIIQFIIVSEYDPSGDEEEANQALSELVKEWRGRSTDAKMCGNDDIANTYNKVINDLKKKLEVE